jgi:hypothetical protein
MPAIQCVTHKHHAKQHRIYDCKVGEALAVSHLNQRLFFGSLRSYS